MYPLNWSVWQVGTVKRLYLLRTYELVDKVGCVVVAISAGDWGGEVDPDGSYWGHSQSCNEPSGVLPCALWASVGLLALLFNMPRDHRLTIVCHGSERCRLCLPL